jgi:hypothetical protein
MSFKNKTDFPVGVATDPLLDVIVAKNSGFEFTKRELKAFFEAVEDSDNWKNPIDKTVVLADSREILGTLEAVKFFAGCVPEFHFAMTDNGPAFRVKAVGYYVAVGA